MKKKNLILILVSFLIGSIVSSFVTWFVMSTVIYEQYSNANFVPKLESNNFNMKIIENSSFIFNDNFKEGANCKIDPKAIIKNLSSITKVHDIDPVDEIETSYLQYFYACKEFNLSKGKAYFINTNNHDLIVFVPTNKPAEIVVQTSANYPAQSISEVRFDPDENELVAYKDGWDTVPKVLDLRLK